MGAPSARILARPRGGRLVRHRVRRPLPGRPHPARDPVHPPDPRRRDPPPDLCPAAGREAVVEGLPDHRHRSDRAGAGLHGRGRADRVAPVRLPVLASFLVALRATGPGWTAGTMTPWHDGGKVVMFFYGASWCPYCSAGSWTIWKALQEYGGTSGNTTGYSSLSDVYSGTPEMILANVQLSSSNVSFQVSEDTSGVDGNFPGTSNCYQAAYVSAYSGSAIPFLVVNGQFLHAGTPIINPATLGAYNYANTSGSSG